MEGWKIVLIVIGVIFGVMLLLFLIPYIIFMSVFNNMKNKPCCYKRDPISGDMACTVLGEDATEQDCNGTFYQTCGQCLNAH